MSRIARPCLCLVTDRRRLTPDARTVDDETMRLERWLDEAIDAGVDLIQIRERDLDARRLCALTAAVVSRARGTQTIVVINERADVARAAEADGVHLRADGPPVDRVRRLGRPGWLVGRSIHDPREAAGHGSADYLVFGTVFPSASKAADAHVQGLGGLQLATGATSTAVLAIGGITVDRAARCVRAGAAGIAAIGLFLPAGRSPESLGAGRAIRELRAAC